MIKLENATAKKNIGGSAYSGTDNPIEPVSTELSAKGQVLFEQIERSFGTIPVDIATVGETFNSFERGLVDGSTLSAQVARWYGDPMMERDIYGILQSMNLVSEEDNQFSNAAILGVESYAQALYPEIADLLPSDITERQIAQQIAQLVENAIPNLSEAMDNPELQGQSIDSIFVDYASELDREVFESLAVWLIDEAEFNGANLDDAMDRINRAMDSISMY